MKKLFSLIRACLKDNMSLFKIKGKNKNSKYLPIFLGICVMGSLYANAYVENSLVSKLILSPSDVTSKVSATPSCNLITI